MGPNTKPGNNNDEKFAQKDNNNDRLGPWPFNGQSSLNLSTPNTTNPSHRRPEMDVPPNNTSLLYVKNLKEAWVEG